MYSDKLEYILRLGDSALILGQQLCRWCGHAPVLEEDIAVANTALDLIGQARFWLDAAGSLEGVGRTADDFAYHRHGQLFRNVLLVEQPNGDYGMTLMRQFIFDAWHAPLLASLVQSSDKAVSEIAGRSSKEAAYHLQRSRSLVSRLAHGTEESHSRMQMALDGLWPFAAELVTPDVVDQNAAQQGYGMPLELVAEVATETWSSVFADAGLARDPKASTPRGGKRGQHSEHLDYILIELQALQRSHPGAKW